MKVHEVIMRAMSGETAWFQAAEIIGISCRHMRRWKRRWENHGYEGLLDRRRGQPSPKRIRTEKQLPSSAKQKPLAVEMMLPRKATKSVASRSGLEKYAQKLRDFPPFPQPRLLDI